MKLEYCPNANGCRVRIRSGRPGGSNSFVFEDGTSTFSFDMPYGKDVWIVSWNNIFFNCSFKISMIERNKTSLIISVHSSNKHGQQVWQKREQLRNVIDLLSTFGIHRGDNEMIYFPILLNWNKRVEYLFHIWTDGLRAALHDFYKIMEKFRT